jgi:hypothetical protein
VVQMSHVAPSAAAWCPSAAFTLSLSRGYVRAMPVDAASAEP